MSGVVIFKNVPTLLDLAFDVSFKEILSNLVLCNDHRPEDKQLVWARYSSFLSTMPYLNGHAMRNLVRSRLDQYLVGIMSDTIREKYVKKFYDSFTTMMQSQNEHFMTDIWVFLDCVLDGSFHELTTHMAFPSSEPNANLITTIANQSPQLKKLKLDFSVMNRATDIGKVKSALLPLMSLHDLTNLFLYNLDQSHSSILNLIGEFCPSLTHLSVSGFRVGKKDILALVLGRLVDYLLPPTKSLRPWSEWKEDRALQHLVVPDKYLSSLCFTLQNLQLGVNSENMEVTASYVNYGVNIAESVNFDEPSAVFLFRHFQSLQKIDGCVPTVGAIKILRTGESGIVKEKSIIQAKFEKACQEASSGLQLFSHSTLPVFSGSLLLTKLDFVSIFYGDLLRLAGSTCPFLKEVAFCDESSHLVPYSRMDEYENFTKDVSPESLESILNGWPKLEIISLLDIPAKFVEPILKAFGAGLKRLTFESCEKINVPDLVYCKQLEALQISGSSCLAEKKTNGNLNAETFLPLLKSFESHSCLGTWSSLFEEKSTLVSLCLNCTHIGIEASTKAKWGDVPKMWPLLEHLDIWQCSELTHPMVSGIFPKLDKLKEVYLPDSLNKKPITVDECSAIIAEQMSLSKPLPIKIRIQTNLRSSQCQFMPHPMYSMFFQFR